MRQSKIQRRLKRKSLEKMKQSKIDNVKIQHGKGRKLKNIPDLIYEDRFTKKHLLLIQKCREQGYDIRQIAKSTFDYEQALLVFKGMQEDLDVRWYNKTKFDIQQMNIIYKGLKDGLDVSIYANNKYSFNEMNKIYHDLKYSK